MLNKRSLQAFQSRLEERERNPGDSNLGKKETFKPNLFLIKGL